MEIVELFAAIVTVLGGIIATIKYFRGRRRKNQTSLVEQWLSLPHDDYAAPNISVNISRYDCINMTIDEWHKHLRRKLICPFWASNINSGELGYVKRVMPLQGQNLEIILQVTTEEGNSFWSVSDTYPTDRLSHNADLIQCYREEYMQAV